MGTRRKILLVDDEGAILKILSIKLRVSGYDVVTARDGEEALGMIDSERPDLMLLDIIMPKVDGLQVLERLRARSSIPVIAFSARRDNARKVLDLGGTDFLTKPFDVDDLVKRIDSVLGNNKHPAKPVIETGA